MISYARAPLHDGVDRFMTDAGACRAQQDSAAIVLASLLWRAAKVRPPCAGQGYIWLTHRDPASAAWHLARESCSQWQRLLRQPHLSPSQVEWQSSGSLLLATDAEEAEQLRARREMLGRAGVSARYLDERALRCEEPALHGSVAGGLLVSNDSQLVRPAMALQWRMSPQHRGWPLGGPCFEHQALRAEWSSCGKSIAGGMPAAALEHLRHQVSHWASREGHQHRPLHRAHRDHHNQ